MNNGDGQLQTAVHVRLLIALLWTAWFVRCVVLLTQQGTEPREGLLSARTPWSVGVGSGGSVVLQVMVALVSSVLAGSLEVYVAFGIETHRWDPAQQLAWKILCYQVLGMCCLLAYLLHGVSLHVMTLETSLSLMALLCAFERVPVRMFVLRVQPVLLTALLVCRASSCSAHGDECTRGSFVGYVAVYLLLGVALPVAVLMALEMPARQQQQQNLELQRQVQEQSQRPQQRRIAQRAARDYTT